MNVNVHWWKSSFSDTNKTSCFQTEKYNIYYNYTVTLVTQQKHFSTYLNVRISNFNLRKEKNIMHTL